MTLIKIINYDFKHLDELSGLRSDFLEEVKIVTLKAFDANRFSLYKADYSISHLISAMIFDGHVEMAIETTNAVVSTRIEFDNSEADFDIQSHDDSTKHATLGNIFSISDNLMKLVDDLMKIKHTIDSLERDVKYNK